MNTTASIITAVIQTAASVHCHPVEPITLLDKSLTFHRQCLRGQINAIIAWHLHHNHKLPIVKIAHAYKLDWGTTYNRVLRGKILSRKSPWKQTYLKLP